MNPETAFVLHVLALVALLILASIAGFLLAQSRDAPDPVVDYLNQRIWGWWMMLALIGVASLLGRPGLLVLFALASFTALREFITLAETRRGDPYAIVVTFFVVLPAQYVLVGEEQIAFYSLFIPVYAFLFLPVIAAVGAETTRFLERVSTMQWALMLAVYGLSHVAALTTLEIPGDEGGGLLLIAFLVLVVQSSDILQYAAGRFFGKRGTAPTSVPTRISEEFLGVAGGTLIGAAFFWLTPFSPWMAALVAFAVALSGFLGGLVLSAIRRDRGVKDWGQTIAGHGGLLDRLDSVVFAAPVFFHLLRWFWAAGAGAGP